MSAKPRVAVLKTRPESVVADVGRTMEMADFTRHLEPGATTILKDNISWHFPYPGANTTPWQLEGTILKLREAGFHDQVCVQNNTVVTDPKKGERLNRYLPVLDEYGIPVRYNCFPEDLKWIRYEPKGKMLVLPTVKCHIYTTTTGAMKNAFGGLLNTRRHYTHSWIHETLVDLLTIQKEIHSGLFAMMDGTTCGNGPGPRTMIPVEKDVLLASADQVAIDAVAAKMMGFDPLSIKYIRLAHEAGLGCGDPRDIEVVGEDVSKWNFRFSVGDNFASRIGDLMWFGPLKGLQKLFFHTPLVYLFVFGSFFYHDYAWYPTVGRRRIERYKRDSKWMRLFEQYPEAEVKRAAA
jgi:Domain of unknown function (DUF362)